MRYHTVYLGLNLPRDILYGRINHRVDQMIAAIEAQGYQPVCKSWEPLDEAYACGKSA